MLAYLKLLEMVYVRALLFDVSKYVIKFWSTNVSAYAIFDGLREIPCGNHFSQELNFSNFALTLTDFARICSLENI